MKKELFLYILLSALGISDINAGNTQDEDKKTVFIKLKDSNGEMQRISADKTLARPERIKFMKNLNLSRQEAFINSAPAGDDMEVTGKYWINNVISCKVSEDMIEKLRNNPAVEYIGTDPGCKIEFNPVMQNTSEALAAHVKMVNAAKANEYGYTGKDIVVGIIDSGVNYNHKDIKHALWDSEQYPLHGWDFYDNDNDPMDEYGHGTHCAGIIAGNGETGTRTGVAPDAKLMILKVSNSLGYVGLDATLEAIQFAVENGADVLSMSLGWPSADNATKKMWRETMSELLGYNVLAVAAAGNEGNKLSSYPIPNNVRVPAACPPAWIAEGLCEDGNTSTTSVLAVGSIDQDGFTVSDFSSRGPVTWQDVAPYNDFPYNPGIGLIRPDISAPGSNILSLSHKDDNGYTFMSGTSMATPCVAGIVATMLSKNRNLTPADIVRILSESSKKIATEVNPNTGAGRADALNATFRTPNTDVNVTEITFVETGEGNKNYALNPGEVLKASIYIENTSDNDITDYTIEVQSLSDKAVITEIATPSAVLKKGEKTLIEDLFTITIDEETGIGDEAEITFVIRTADATYTNMMLPKVQETRLTTLPYQLTGIAGSYMEKGETAGFDITIQNIGNEVCNDVKAELIFNSPYFTVIDSISKEKADIEEEKIYSFTAKISEETPEFYFTTFSLKLTGTNIDTTFTYNANVGKKGALVIDKSKADGKTSGQVLAEKLTGLGISTDIVTVTPEDLGGYASVWYCAGVYPDNRTAPREDVGIISLYLQQGGKVYMEGGDIWSSKQVSFRELFHVKLLGDDGGDLTTIAGTDKYVNDRQRFDYTLDARYIDHIIPADENAVAMYMNTEPEYTVTVGNIQEDRGITIASSIEIAGVMAESDEMLYTCLDFMDVAYTRPGTYTGSTAILKSETERYVCGEENARIKASITAGQNEAITSITAQCIAAGKTITKNISGFRLEKGQTFIFAFDEEIPVETGETFSYTIKATANGTQLEDVEGQITAYAFRPVHGIVVEGLEGMNCGKSPETTVAMQWLEKKYPENFIGISIHTGDVLAQEDYAAAVGMAECPAALVNRAETAGDILALQEDRTGEFFSIEGGIDGDFEKAMALLPRNEVAASAEIKDGKIYVKATVTPATDIENNGYRMAFALVEDYVRNDNYYQTNDFAGSQAEIGGFEDMPQKIEGKSYDFQNVARGIWPSAEGMADVLPATLEHGNTYEVEYTIELPGNIMVVQNVDVIAMLIDGNTGMIENAAIWNNPEKSSTNSPLAEEERLSFHTEGETGVIMTGDNFTGKAVITLTRPDGQTAYMLQTEISNGTAVINTAGLKGIFILTVRTENSNGILKVVL